MKEKFKYCTVVPKFKQGDFYYYLDCAGNVEVGSYVEVPFEDQMVIGIVTEIEYFENGYLPWPLEKMKPIGRIISKKEFEKFSFADFLGEKEEERYELFEFDRVIIKKLHCITGTIVDKTWEKDANEFFYKVEPDSDIDNWHLKSYTCYELEKI